MRASITGWLVLALVAGCSESLEGPKPALDAPAAGRPLEPGYVCGEQLTTPVVLHGERLAPVVVGLPDHARTALPQVSLTRGRLLDGATADGPAQTWLGTDAESTGLTWQDAQTMTLEIHPELALPAGLYDLQVINPQGESVLDAGPLAVADAPELAAVTPGVVCLAQGDRTLTASGAGFLQIADAAPRIAVGEADRPFDSFSGCVDIPHPSVPGKLCTTGEFTLPRDAVPPGYPAVVINNPETAACHSEETINLRVVPPPSIERVDPPLACPVEGERDVTLHGADLLRIDGALPGVTMTLADGSRVDLAVGEAGGCEPLEAMGVTVERCSSVTVTLPRQAIAEPYHPTLELTNPAPAGCLTSTSTGLTLVPPPDVAEVQPLYLCRNVETVAVQVSGRDFLTVDGTPPAVTLGGQAASAVRPTDCAPLEVEGLAVERCGGFEADFAPGDLGEAESLTVENPAPAGCSDTFEQRLVVLDPPIPVTVEPGLLCTEDGARQIVVDGMHFIGIGDARPSVRIGETTVVADALEGCTPRTEGDLAWQDCTRLIATLPQGPLPEGHPRVEIIDPAPAGCASGADGLLTVPPSVTIASVEPSGICIESGDREITVAGTGFLVVDGVEPTLTLNGAAVAATVGGCAPLDYPGHEAQACTTLTTLIPQGSLPQGAVEVAVSHADPALCGHAAADVFFIVPVPTIASIEPTEVCEADVDTFTIRGSDFTPVARVFVGDVAATAVRFIDETTLEATFADGLLPGVYDVRVVNAEGCEATEPAILEVHPTPIVFFVDPPIAYSGINLQVTIYTTGLDAAPDTVHLLGPHGEEVELADARPAPDRPNKIFATVPAGLASGAWTVRVTSRLGCEGELPGALTVTADLRIGLTGIDPAYVSPTVTTAVTVRAEAGDGQVGFASTPRAYLNPNPADPGTVAMALRAVVFVDAATLTAAVPGGLPAGRYDVIVVNPDATVGVMEAALTVTEGEPPIIDGVEPASLDGNGPQEARIFGEQFSVAAGGSVTMTCRTPDGMTGEANAPIVRSSDTEVVARLPADQFAAGSICLITLTNADGAASRFSAVSIKTPAQNLNPWRAAAAMTTARRAPGLAAGRPTRTSRYLYAVGGDAGGAASALGSVEATPIDVFGDMGAWAEQRHALPAPRTLAGATRLGRFLYLLGGNDGAGPVDTVWRAEILDPLAGPEIVDLGLTIEADAPNIGGGVWHYRVAAVYAADDARNPGGESLPGEVLVVQLPEIPGLQITLTWAEVPGAVAYRVYRTAEAGEGVDAVRLLAEVAEPRFTDAGAEAGEETPLPPGSLGIWHSAGTLQTAREAAAVVAVPDAAGGWLYVIGGRGAGGVLDTYEVTRVDLADAVGAFRTGASTLSPGRAELGAVRVTHADVAVVPDGQPWLFVGPGRTNGGTSRAVDAAGVEPDGSLTFIPTDEVSGDFAGYGSGGANGFLFLFGGRGGPTDGGISGEICRSANDPGCNRAPDEPADIRNWNNLGVRLTEPRQFMGSAQESAFFFVAGGAGAMGALDSVDQTVQ
ncbi:MAG: IPT/TIG domain-containing protein [bacterium]